MSRQSEVTRRGFMRDAAKVAAGVAGGATVARADVYKRILPQTVMGANEKIRTGHIGVGNYCVVSGIRDVQFVMMRDDMQPIAVCDLYPKAMQQATEVIKQKYPAPAAYTYFEELIANKDVDAVILATPDHWHAVPTIMAVEAGKDVYCAMPLCTTIEEAQAMRAAVRGSKRVFQIGAIQRSGAYSQEAVNMIKGGYIGKVGRVECWCHSHSTIKGIGNPPDEEPPSWLDWERHIGWTPKVPYNKNRYLYNFRWFTDYSGGRLMDWGAQLLDAALWAIGEEKEIRRVMAASGKFILEDNRTTPDTLDAFWEFDDYILSFSSRAWSPDWSENATEKSPSYGIFFHGTLGSMRVDRLGYKVYPFRDNGGCEPVEKRDAMETDMSKAHWQNFADCVRSRQDPICNIDVAYATMVTCVTGKCAYIANAKLEWDAKTEKFVGKDADAVALANEWAYRPYQNGWSLKPPYHANLKV
ncbi:MAG: Gfo/Idh/MocA family oxidoreductase [Candidatus Hydrogenedentes bacterium]|nr:Gfo/Idh/MocA family oxidoreductase [Candidatus Hydrogenedentota bacterium]